VLKPDQKSARKILKQLTLNTTAIWEREKKQISQMPQPPLIIRIPYSILCLVLDFIFEGRYTPARFFYLETVARYNCRILLSVIVECVSSFHKYHTLSYPFSCLCFQNLTSRMPYFSYISCLHLYETLGKFNGKVYSKP
jgi:hypothetical protein